MRLLLGMFFLAAASMLSAAEINLTINPAQVSVGAPFQLVYSVQGDAGEPDFSPLQEDFSLLGTSTSSQFSMVNGHTTQSRQYQLTLSANRDGDLVIPAINFGREKSQERKIQVSKGQAQPIQPDGAPAGENIIVLTEVDNPSPFVQQQVILTIRILRRIDWQRAVLSDLDTGGQDVLAQQLGEDESYRTTHQGKSYVAVERRLVLFPQQSGKLVIAPFRLTASVPSANQQRSPQAGQFPDFFSLGHHVQQQAVSKPVELNVQPVPDEFKGGRWLVANSLTLEETWSQPTDQLKAGESVTRTVGLIADGVSIGMLPQIELAAQPGLKVYPDQPATHEQASADGVLSTSNFKFALIPSQAGKINLPEIRIPWWNAKTNQQEEAVLPAHELLVQSGDAMAPPTQASAPVTEPVETQAEPAKPVPTQQQTPPTVAKDTDQDNWLLIGLLGFAFLWLVTLLIWWRGRKRARFESTPVASENVGALPVEEKPDQMLQFLTAACQRQDAKATRDAVMAIAKKLWPHQGITSLEAVQARVEPTLAEALRALNAHLYGAGRTSWNPDAVRSGMSQLLQVTQGEAQIMPSNLEPLNRL